MNYKVWITINGVNYVPVFDLRRGWVLDVAVFTKFTDKHESIAISDLEGVIDAIEEDFQPDEYTIEIFACKD